MFEDIAPKFEWNPKRNRWIAKPANNSELARRLALLSLAGYSRLIRKHYAVPALRLKEKLADRDLAGLAKLAKIEHDPSFGDHIRSLVLDAHKQHSALSGSSTISAKSALTRVISTASQLKDVLSDIDVGAAKEYSGKLLETELEKTHFRDQPVLIPDLMELTDLIIAAARAARAVKGKRGRKPAAGGNPAFDEFVEGLYIAALQRRGNWTISRVPKSAVYKGSMLCALELLQPYLPDGFYPEGNLGRSVEHILGKLRDHIDRFENHHSK